MIRKIVLSLVVLFGCLCVTCLSGCASAGLSAPSGMPNEFGNVTQSMVDIIGEQGYLKDFALNANMNAIEPSVEMFYTQEHKVGVRLGGTQVEATGNAEGENKNATNNTKSVYNTNP